MGKWATIAGDFPSAVGHRPSGQTAAVFAAVDRPGDAVDRQNRHPSAVLNRPRPNRRLLRVASSLKPRARRTWLGSGLADVQALPELTARSLHAHQQRLAVDVGELTFRLPGRRGSLRSS